ncbi:MAG: hypothetical protein IK990_19035 [Ruminiclostridium sp.]|nr:hypothetical protein [Ruminiclostridium sp.]
MTGTYRMAGKVIGINSLYDEVHRYCADYRCDGKPDFCVTVSQSDIDRERAKSLNAQPPLTSPRDAYLEELAVYRKIAEKMPDYDTILFHGSVVAVDGAGYLFTARSGTGKSTHTRLWRELFGSRAVMVNDDKPLLHIADTVTACGTPYNGKHRLSANISVPLKAVCVLTRAAENSIVRIDAHTAYPVLLQQAYRPADVEAMRKTVELLDGLTRSVKLFRLGCNMNIEAAQIAYEAMSRE